MEVISKKLIIDKLNSYKFKVKEFQVDIIYEILDSFLNGYTNVILNAPTGVGKSVIGFIVADILGDIEKEKLKSIILIQNNSLVDQYKDMFQYFSNTEIIKGADNYECEILNKSAKYCIYNILKEQKSKGKLYNCYNCKFKKSRQKINEIPHLITNYQYFFISRLYSDHLEKRLITIYDECHEINDAFSNSYTIYISEQLLNEYLKELQSEDPNILSRALNIFNFVSILDKDYRKTLNFLFEAYSLLEKYFHDKALERVLKNDYKGYYKYKSKEIKYKGLGCKIDDLLKYNYTHTVDINNVTNELTIKPVFINDLFSSITFSKFNLFMSATIHQDFIIKTLNLDKNAIKFIGADSPFKKENKKVIFLNSHTLNYKNTKDSGVIQKISDICNLIIEKKHKNEKGIILTPSFYLTNEIFNNFIKLNSIKVFKHESGQILNLIINDFKLYNGPALLISPSLFIGIDLPNDFSRFQIMIKAPFHSLGDSRMSYILKNYPDIYNIITMFKIIQGFGRSTRNEHDYSTTYCLDTNIKRLFNIAPLEIQNQFDIINV